MRKFIDLMETIKSGSVAEMVSGQIRQGQHEGFNPYWKLTADPRVLADEAAMGHIADLVAEGFLSGVHPAWELKVIEAETNGDTPHDDPEMVKHRGIQSYLDAQHDTKMVDEEVIDVVHSHMVAAVAETKGPGEGWYEVDDHEATLFVVEDEHGIPIEGFETREEAQAHADELNSGVAPSDTATHGRAMDHEIVEDDEHLDAVVDDLVDDAPLDTPEPADAPTMFDRDADYVVILNCVHDRGHRQDEAFRELNKRGLWLSDEQKAQSGR